jgi:hypothetical protein
LEEYKKEIISIFGGAFIGKMNECNSTGMIESDAIKASVNAHPFSHWWAAFIYDISLCKESGSFQLSETSMRMLDLLSDLRDICSLPNYMRILNSIRNNSTFFSACFEAHIAAGYVNMGQHVEIQKEGVEENVRTSDLRVIANNKPVFLECKSLDDFKIKKAPLWNQLMFRISKNLKKYQRSWIVTILAGKQIDGKDMEKLCRSIIEDIKNEKLGETTCEEKYKIQYRKLLDKGQEARGSLSIKGKIAEIGSFETEMYIGPDGIPVHQSVNIIQILPHAELDISSRLISELKKAVKQIPDQGPGIIHIQIPYSRGTELLKVVDTVYDNVYRKLNRDSRRVNAVVISADVLEIGSAVPVVRSFHIVPNNSPVTELPAEFSIIGAHDMGIPLSESENEGTVEFDFVMTSEMKPGIPSVLFEHCDKSGKYQLRIWKTWGDRLRMDVVSPVLRRVFIEADHEEFSLDKKNRFGGTWSTRELTMFINGQKRASKKLDI